MYTFSGWDASDDADLTENGIEGDVTFKGEWTFTPDPVDSTDLVDPTDPVDPTESTKPTDPTSPQTGDNIFLWVALLFISGGALVGTSVYGKRRKRTE